MSRHLISLIFHENHDLWFKGYDLWFKVFEALFEVFLTGNPVLKILEKVTLNPPKVKNLQ